MKPVFQTNRPARHGESLPGRNIQKSPAVEWSYQASSPALRGPGRMLRPGFHSLQDLSAAAKREARVEAIVLAVIGALAVGPIVFAVHAASMLLK